MTVQIDEKDLHAYVDGQLDAGRRAQVDGYLASQPHAQEQVRQWRNQNHALHRLYDGVMNEAIPRQLTAATKPQPMRHALAAGIACLACGLGAGWFAHGALTTPGTATASSAFARNALAAHVLYAAEKRHPVEVTAEQQAHLLAWLSKRLEAPIHAPDLRDQGFTLLGGRLLPGDEGPLAQLMYESAAGERLTLTVRHAERQQPESGFQLMETNGHAVFYWIDRDYGYALSGGITKARILDVAHAVHASLQP
ncbi:anti-sigma factor [Janthinobacterium sp. 17J80-10]|uniref:anti-sigma factor family protein n=1 Tax=Janthinobacterium sp. 17J80-10 TaxID=2497863 RepID=UPI001005A838|nr:anti-sigma factor [Janthinobacterium sp. 17J80-10]QAU35864.1 anti-sigma factor [Janthinobacterium sp. 17J80-10]